MQMTREDLLTELRNPEFAGPMIHFRDWAALHILMHRAAALLEEAEFDDIVRQARAPMTYAPTNTPTLSAREAIARLVDPEAWRKHDQIVLWADRGAYDDGGPLSQHEAEGLIADAGGLVLEPLTKADAILALPPVAGLATALRWYEEMAAGCRKVTSEGETARRALDRDGGQRARAALSHQAESEG
jgi:hypothetical protein